MSVDILVIRAPGDKRGPDIVSGLLSNISIALVRGEKEINDNEPVRIVTLTTKYRTGVKHGQLLEVMDALQGTTWRGRVRDISHYMRKAELWTDLEIEKPVRYN